MAFQLSPGVVTSEIDLTTVIPAASVSTGAYAGPFQWGPAEAPLSVTSEDDLVKVFGKPNANTSNSFFTCANFLSYASDLKVVRSINASTTAAGSNNASSGASNNSSTYTASAVIKNFEDFDTNFSNTINYGPWIARYPGAKGNSIRVSYCDTSNTTLFNSWAYASYFNDAPGTSDYVSKYTSTTLGALPLRDEFHLVVIDEDGEFSGIKGSVLETFGYLSKASDARDDQGNSLYYINVINQGSNYIYATKKQLISNGNWGTPASVVGAFSVSSGASASLNPTTSSVYGASRQFTIPTDSGITSTLGKQLRIYGANSQYSINFTMNCYVTTATSTTMTVTVSQATFSSAVNASNTYTCYITTPYSRFNHGESTNPLYAVADSRSLYGGNDGVVSEANTVVAFNKLANPEQVDISLVMTGNLSGPSAKSVIENVAEVRKDCVVFVSPPLANTLLTPTNDPSTSIVNWRNSSTHLNKNSSYAIMDSGWKYQYDKYNDAYVWVPLNGDIAGLCARTDDFRDPWFSPAGLTRGQIKNVVKLAFNPNKTERDTLYKNGVNPVVSFPGEGIVLFGDKTLLKTASAFDRINVRRLFIVLEKSISRAARGQLFEFNDEFTRSQFVSIVEPFLRQVKGRRGIFDYKVVCDETNNTPQVIDNNQFVGDIYVKPARSINFIQLNFVAVRSGVAFNEIVGKF